MRLKPDRLPPSNSRKIQIPHLRLCKPTFPRTGTGNHATLRAVYEYSSSRSLSHLLPCHLGAVVHRSMATRLLLAIGRGGGLTANSVRCLAGCPAMATNVEGLNAKQKETLVKVRLSHVVNYLLYSHLDSFI